MCNVYAIYAYMLRCLYIIIIFIGLILPIDSLCQVKKDTVVFYWNKWHSDTLDKTMSGVVAIIKDSVVVTYVHDFGYLHWNAVEKSYNNEYYLSRKDGDKCYMKIYNDRIFLLYSFVYKDMIIHENVILRLRVFKQ